MSDFFLHDNECVILSGAIREDGVVEESYATTAVAQTVMYSPLAQGA